jgi:cytoskeletal protein CcmA (bactofilin family)
MFKKSKKINPNTTDTLIGAGTTFEGKIKSEASLRIEGQITGDIDCIGDVILGEQGIARSNITARNITIAGIVHGNIQSKAQLTITATGQLLGNVSTHALIIAEGGIFQGQSRMQQEAGKPEIEKEKESASAAYNNQAYSNSVAK